jgi:structural toxin protein (hemagglutinin/hemolysin) RtxA
MMCKLEFYVPETHLEKVKSAVFAAGAGKMGNYDCCSWETAGTGQFRPCKGSKPFIGQKDRIEKVREFKVELVCDSKRVKKVIAALKKSHPYETPAYQYWEVKS